MFFNLISLTCFVSLYSSWLKNVTIDHDARAVDLSNVISANGKHFILNCNRCGLCGMKNGYKTKCTSGRCHAHGELNKPYHFHVTCARQVGFEVAHNENDQFVGKFILICGDVSNSLSLV